MRVRTGDHPRGRTSGGASARAARRWRAAALVVLADVAVLLAARAERDSHPPQGPETATAIAARPGVEQVEPLGGKLYPPRYDTLDYQLNQLVARHEGRDAGGSTTRAATACESSRPTPWATVPPPHNCGEGPPHPQTSRQPARQPSREPSAWANS